MPRFLKLALLATALLLGTLLAAALVYDFFFEGLSVSKRVRSQAELVTLETVLRAYAADNGTFPTTEQGLDALVNRPHIPPIPANWRRLYDRIHPDPWGHDYVYRFPSSTDSAAFDLFCLGPDGVESTDDIRARP